MRIVLLKGYILFIEGSSYSKLVFEGIHLWRHSFWRDSSLKGCIICGTNFWRDLLLKGTKLKGYCQTAENLSFNQCDIYWLATKFLVQPLWIRILVLFNQPKLSKKFSLKVSYWKFQGTHIIFVKQKSLKTQESF